MKTKTVKRFFSMLLVATMVVGACFTTASAAAPDDGQVEPRIHYEYDIPDFSLEPGEIAYTTRYGYGFDVSTEGLNHNDFDLTFKTEGAAVDLTISLLTLSDYIHGNYDNELESINVIGARTENKESFLNLSNGTYVIKWENTGSKTLYVSNAHLSTSY